MTTCVDCLSAVPRGRFFCDLCRQPAPFRFFLGAHHPHWLADPRFSDVPLFVSHRSLGRYRTLPRATGTWALDSGGFTELSLYGRWFLQPADYARSVLRYRDEVGGLAWAAPQDWMCEPQIRQATGLTVEEHQRRTIASVQELRALGAPVIPVLQGWGLWDYLRHVEGYDRAGIDLRAEPVVGVGTVCRRQKTGMAATLMHMLHAEGIRTHGFGFKATGLRACHTAMASADSLAWSYHARREPPMPGHSARHKNCANCPDFALSWREDLLASLPRTSGWTAPLFGEDRSAEVAREADELAALGAAAWRRSA